MGKRKLCTGFKGMDCVGYQSGEGAKQIVKQLNKIPHTKYVEPFAGHGNVFLAKNQVKPEILNDISCKQTQFIKSKVCSLENQQKCDRLKEAKVTCGKDWKQFLRHDSKDTLFYLDPPYEKVAGNKKGNSSQQYKDRSVPFKEVVDKAKQLEGKVAISYSNLPEFRKELCKKPFQCVMIKKNIFGKYYKEILAIKK